MLHCERCNEIAIGRTHNKLDADVRNDHARSARGQTSSWQSDVTALLAHRVRHPRPYAIQDVYAACLEVFDIASVVHMSKGVHMIPSDDCEVELGKTSAGKSAILTLLDKALFRIALFLCVLMAKIPSFEVG